MKTVLIIANGLAKEGGIGNCLYNMLKVFHDHIPDLKIDLYLNDYKSSEHLGNDFNNVKAYPLEWIDDISGSTKKLILNGIRKKQIAHTFKLLWNRLLYKMKYRLPLIQDTVDALKPIEKHYDYAVAYNCIPNYLTSFTAQKVKADVKIAWAHITIDQKIAGVIKGFSTLQIKSLRSYQSILEQFNGGIISVSEGVKNSISAEFPGLEIPLDVIYNITDRQKVINLSKEKVEMNSLWLDYDGIKLLTVGRLSYEKGIDLAVQALKRLKDEGHKFKWFFMGHDHRSSKIKEYIYINHLEDYFVYLGVKSNPYPYFKQCDIYVHNSHVEGFCTTVNEARMLGKPVVTTRAAGAEEQIYNDVNGYVVDADSEEIFKAIKKLLDSKEIREKFALYNHNLEFNNEDSINKIKSLFED